MIAWVTGFTHDADAGATNEIRAQARVLFVGSDVPNGILVDQDPVIVTFNITSLSGYPVIMRNALIARAAALGLPALTGPNCLFPTYTRGT